MALYLVGSAIPAVFADEGASDRMDSKLIGAIVAVVVYAVMIGSLCAFCKLDA